jgi:hypothetical protein
MFCFTFTTLCWSLAAAVSALKHDPIAGFNFIKYADNSNKSDSNQKPFHLVVGGYGDSLKVIGTISIIYAACTVLKTLL